MIEVQYQIAKWPLILQMQPAIEMTRQQFFDFCQLNRDLRIERTAKGDIVIMAPAGEETSAKNAELVMQVVHGNLLSSIELTVPTMVSEPRGQLTDTAAPTGRPPT